VFFFRADRKSEKPIKKAQSRRGKGHAQEKRRHLEGMEATMQSAGGRLEQEKWGLMETQDRSKKGTRRNRASLREVPTENLHPTAFIP